MQGQCLPGSLPRRDCLLGATLVIELFRMLSWILLGRPPCGMKQMNQESRTQCKGWVSAPDACKHNLKKKIDSKFFIHLGSKEPIKFSPNWVAVLIASWRFRLLSHWVCGACVLNCFSSVQPFVTLWIVAHQAPLPMRFSRQGYWSGLLCPPPGDLPDPGMGPRSPALQADSLPSEPPGKPGKEWRLPQTAFFSWERLVFEISKTNLSSCFQHFLFHLLSILWKQWNQTG